MKIYIFFLLYALVTMRAYTMESPHDKVLIHDLKTYLPQRLSLNNISFKVQIPEIKKLLEENVYLGKVDNVYFEVFWFAPGKYVINVRNIPKEFVDLKANLKTYVTEILAFVIPETMQSKLRSYKVANINATTLVAMDETNAKFVNKIELDSSSEGLFDHYKIHSPGTTQEVFIEYKQKPWSQNKFVADKYTFQREIANGLVTQEYRIEYQLTGGVAFPSFIEKIQKIRIGKDTKERVLKYKIYDYVMNDRANSGALKEQQK